MRELSSEELKKIQLEMLLELDRYCHEHKLTYFMCGGTLLGAVRHKGFIPWDDDIDVLMPRKDYEKLLRNYNEINSCYEIKSVELGDRIPLYINFSNKETIVTNLDGGVFDYGDSVVIDIFPIDQLSDNGIIRYVICYIKELLIYFYHGSILSFVPTKRYQDRDGGLFNWRTKARTLIKYLFIGLFHKTKPQRWGIWANKISRFWEGKNTKWQGCMMTAAHHNNGLSEILPKEVFSSSVKLEFEGYQLNAMVGYKEYLGSLYGDYMKLPPKEKQVSHHEFVAYYKESK